MSEPARASMSACVEVVAVVDAGAAELDGQAHPAAEAELVAVQAQAEAGGAAGEQHLAALLDVERAGLAERVDEVDVRGHGREHRAGDQVEVVAPVDARRHHMGAEEGDDVGDLGRRPGAPQLAGQVEAVAGLGLQERGALRLGLPAEPPGVGDEVGLARGPGGRHRRGYAAGGISLPAIRASNSAARSPAKTRWVWVSTQPGSTARPPHIHAACRRRARRRPRRARRCGRSRSRARHP